MDIDEIKPIGIINYLDNNEQNIFILDNSTFELYDDMYNIKRWPSITIDLVKLKLEGEKIFSFYDACEWMKSFEMGHNKPQYVIVKEHNHIYRLYCNYFEALAYFRHHILKIDTLIVSTLIRHTNENQKYISFFRSQYKISDLYDNKIIWPSMILYNTINDYFNDMISMSKYNYAYTPSIISSSMNNSTHCEERRYIIEKPSDNIEKQIEKFNKKGFPHNDTNSDIMEVVRIRYNILSRRFNEMNDISSY